MSLIKFLSDIFKPLIFLLASSFAFVFVYSITILGWHNWQRTINGFPLGQFIGLQEIILGLIVGLAMAGYTMDECLKLIRKWENDRQP
jgi:TRAP-type C4-dicarboxylate transport system permease small subunit